MGMVEKLDCLKYCETGVVKKYLDFSLRGHRVGLPVNI